MLEMGKTYRLAQEINCCFLKGDRVKVKKIDIKKYSVVGQKRANDTDPWEPIFSDGSARVLLYTIDGHLRIWNYSVSHETRHIDTEWLDIKTVERCIEPESL